MAQENKSFSFLHGGNVFLDAPMPRLRSGGDEDRTEEKRQAFSRLIDKVRQENVSLVLLGGNLVDGVYAARDTLRFLCEAFASVPTCQFVVCTGEEDKYEGTSIYSYELFPDNVHIFTSATVSSLVFADLGVCVYGWGYASGDKTLLSLEDLVTDKTMYTVFCGPDNTFSGEGESLLWKKAKSKGANYVGLTAKTASFEGFCKTLDGLAAYSGSFEACGFEECGPCGVNLLSVDREEGGFVTKPERLAVDLLRYAVEEIDISALTRDEIERALHACVSSGGYGEKTVLRVVYTGEVAPDFLPPRFADFAAFGVYALQICDRTLPTKDAAYLERESSALGRLYRSLLPKMKTGTQEERTRAVRAFRLGYAALLGKDMADI
ncbi:MAG: hypothetical protein J6K61_04390 [Clostridia bacterium]|nr:hypothetical protein [Clostridia bacterium]